MTANFNCIETIKKHTDIDAVIAVASQRVGADGEGRRAFVCEAEVTCSRAALVGVN